MLHNQCQWIHGNWLGLLRISLKKKISLRFINFQGTVQVLHEDLGTLVADLTKAAMKGPFSFLVMQNRTAQRAGSAYQELEKGNSSSTKKMLY